MGYQQRNAADMDMMSRSQRAARRLVAARISVATGLWTCMCCTSTVAVPSY
jgi:ribosomal protein L37AE/L43A